MENHRKFWLCTLLRVGLLIAFAISATSTASAQVVCICIDPNMGAPSARENPLNPDLSIDQARRIRFKNAKMIADYFDNWLAQDTSLMSREDLTAGVLRLAYGIPWSAWDPTLQQAEHKKEIRKKMWWVTVPTATFGTTSVFGSSVEFPGTPVPAGQFLPVKINTNINTTYSLTWNIGVLMFQRAATKDALDARLAAEYKMRSEAVKPLGDAIAARRAAQFQLRASLLELLALDPKDADRLKDLRKAIDAAWLEMIKRNSEIDMLTSGSARGAFARYAVFVPPAP